MPFPGKGEKTFLSGVVSAEDFGLSVNSAKAGAIFRISEAR